MKNGDCNLFVLHYNFSTIRQRLDKFGSFFYYATGGVCVPADDVEKGECTPDDALLASVRVHAIAPRHIRVSPYPDGDRCKATPLISTKRNLKRTTLSASRFRFFICCYSTRKIYTVWVNEESLLFCYKTVKGYCAVCESLQTTDM